MGTNDTPKDTSYVKLHDTYFRRCLVPVVITLLLFALIYVIIADTAAGSNNFAPNTGLFSGGAKLFHRRR
jgi:hypothetical protein